MPCATDVIAMLERMELIESVAAVDAAYDKLAQQLTDRYLNAKPLLLVVLNGGLRLASELMQRCTFPMEIETIKAGRYGKGVRGDQVNITPLASMVLTGRHVVLIDDVLDAGRTLASLYASCQEQSPATLRTLVLAVKPDLQHSPIQPDWHALSLPDRFVVGEGMDIAGYGRNLRGIWALAANDEASFS